MADFVSDTKVWNTVDGPSLACSAAALQLIPENIPCLVRLQRLAAVGACLPHRPDAPRLSPSKLRSLLKESVIGDPIVRAQEDPYNDLYTAEVSFHGGPYLIAQGLTERSAYTLSLILRSIFGPAGEELPADYLREAGRLTQVLLRLSHSVLKQAGLSRGTRAPAPRRKEVLVPGETALERLRRAVTFDDATLTEIAPPHALQLLEELSMKPGDHVLTTGPGPDDALVVAPLLATSAGLIVANPGDLATAVRHHLIVLAGRHGCRPQLARLLRECVLADVTETLALSGATLVRASSPIAEDAQISRRRFTFADDKSIDLAVIADDLADYDDQDPYGYWDAAGLMQRAQSLLDSPSNACDEDVRCLRLVISQGIGRASAFGLREPSLPGPFLAITAEDLHIMAELDGTDPLFLWRFAQADAKLHAESRVHSFGKLDNYGLYRDNDYSYYMSDEGRPTGVMVDSDFGDALRVEVFRRFDHHIVVSPHRRALVPVVAVYGVETAPIYRTHVSVPEDEFLVETAGLHIWVQSSEKFSDKLEAFHDAVSEAVAYWIWQFSLATPLRLRALADQHECLRVVLSFDDQKAWQDVLTEEGTSPAIGTPWVQARDHEAGVVRLNLTAAGASVLLREDNEADRQIVRTLAGLPTGTDESLLSDTDLLVEQVAPYGHKKMLQALANPMLLRPGALPVARLVQPAASSLVLDELGIWLTEQGCERGVVPADKRLDLLNRAVDHCFQRIRATVAGLLPDDLMTQLMARHEALIRTEAHLNQVLPAKLACFGPDSQPALELANESRQRVVATQASRFLIEYVAATPPTGDLPLTLDSYDTLMAIAAELISRATLSDAIRYDFSTVQLSMLGSGRLGVSRGDRYETGTNALALARAQSAMAGTDEDLVTQVASNAPGPSAEVEEAMLAEFGFTLTELAHGIGEMLALSDTEGRSGPITLPHAHVQSHLHASLGWADVKVHSFLDQLTLRPRAEFLSVGADAWPWRFNRRWSYARRPLVHLDTATGALLAWAPRHLWSTGRYWVDLLYSGRLKASSKRMKKLKGSIRQGHNKEFEKDSQQALARAGCTITAHSVDKIAGRRLVSPEGNDLGDIDALGIATEHKKIFVVEAKDFEMARNPFELANEADALLRGDKSATFKIARRARWISTHLALVLRQYTGSSEARGWTVVPVVVTSRDLMTSRVLASKVPVVAIHQLTSWAQAHGTRGGGAKRRKR
ncbi:hypothetical protein [Streptomyces clavifer]|uniref:hypothetical protein n=1 Tax=Streptomyces clavifer TaxID=68188 RepID=UPI00371B88EB